MVKAEIGASILPPFLEHKEHCTKGQKCEQGTKPLHTFLSFLVLPVSAGVSADCCLGMKMPSVCVAGLTPGSVPHTMKPSKVELWKESE